jgi:hypothetical protein
MAELALVVDSLVRIGKSLIRFSICKVHLSEGPVVDQAMQS